MGSVFYSPHLMGKVFYNPTSFWVRLRALDYLWVVCFLTLPPFENAFEPHTLGSVFSNPVSFQTRLWALTSWVVGVIIFGSVRFLSKKVTKLKFFKKTKPKPGQMDRFQFDFLGKKTSSNRFGSVFPVLARFSRFLARFFSVLARFFFLFFVSVRFGFFSFLLIKPKPNRPGFSKF